MKHYTYKITDPRTSEYYFGVRSHEDPYNDTYMGSYTTWVPENEDRLIKEIIKDDYNTRELAIEAECKLIEEHIDDDLNRNYHIPSKGFHRSGAVNSQSMRRKLSKTRIETGIAKGENNPMYGKQHLSNAKKKMRKTAKGRWTLEWFIERYGEGEGQLKYKEKNELHSIKVSGENNSNYGKRHTKETKEKQSKIKIGNKHASKTILQLNENGNVLQEYESITQAAKAIGVSISAISGCLRGRLNSAAGYIWKYK